MRVAGNVGDQYGNFQCAYLVGGMRRERGCPGHCRLRCAEPSKQEHKSCRLRHARQEHGCLAIISSPRSPRFNAPVSEPTNRVTARVGLCSRRVPGNLGRALDNERPNVPRSRTHDASYAAKRHVLSSPPTDTDAPSAAGFSCDFSIDLRSAGGVRFIPTREALAPT